MNDSELLTLADEISATVKAEVRAVMGPAQARIAELGSIVATLNADVEVLKARIEQVAKEPRVVLSPQFVVPQVAPPAVHVSPIINIPVRKPMKRTIKKMADGSFETEES